MSIMPRMGRCFSCGYDHGNGFGDERLLNALARITELESAIEARSLPANERAADEAYERAAKVCEGIAADRWRLYKGRAPYTGSEPGRANSSVHGESDGADACANTIRALIGKR